MRKQQELSEIIGRLYADAEADMGEDELEAILNEELSKPEEQMDADLVQEILLLLDDGEEGLGQQEAWKKTAEKLKKKRLHPVVKWTARLAAILVIVLGMSVLTYKTAEAFNWQLVLRLMRPLAETFMLYSEQKQEAIPYAGETYDDGLKLDEPLQFTGLEQAPEQLLGYPARPYGVPERFAYLQGSCYADDLSTSVTHTFSSDGGICIFTLTILNDEDLTTSYQYERTLNEPREQYLAGCRVMYYYNSDNMTMSACWTRDGAQYSVFGSIDEAELTSIVKATMEGR
ncbi:MAG: DUF4367 domain-containing protein [Clostridia bacterium]|nr:DUF4367 domain-containing protein [Clostridia bacterium]